jgi:integrase/recombinase XerD
MTNAIAVPLSDVGYIELNTQPTTDKLTLIRAGFLARYRGTTLRDYQADLNVFFAWAQHVDLDPLEAKRPHMELYLRYLEGTGWSSSTIGRRFGTVACMYRFAVLDELLEKDPTIAVKRPKVQNDERRCTYMTALDFGRFTAAAKLMGPVPYALTCLLGLNALRIAEACSLNIEAITNEEGYDVINFIGKGGNTYAAPLSIPAMKAVRAVTAGRDEGPILLNRWGNRMTRSNAHVIIRHIAEAAVIDTHLSPHSLRRTFATTASNVGIPVQDIQEVLRHSQVNTTMRYIKRSAGHDRSATHRMAAYVAGMNG